MSRHHFLQPSNVYKKVNHKFKKVFSSPSIASSESDSSTTSSTTTSLSKTYNTTLTTTNGTNDHRPYTNSQFKLTGSSTSLVKGSPEKVRLKSGTNHFNPVNRYKLTTPKPYTKVNHSNRPKTVVISGSKYKSTRNKLVRSDSLNSSNQVNASVSNPVEPFISPLKSISPFKLTRNDLPNDVHDRDAIERVKSSQTAVATSSQSSTASHQSVSSTRFGLSKKLIKKAVLSSLKLNHIKLLKRNRGAISKSYTVDCIFYTRYGRCNDQDNGCPYNHDPAKVAICTRFLKGKCPNPATCLFSHKTSIERTPVCKYFLSGNCSVNGCNYKHVDVGHDAQICRDFVKFGSCSKFKCSKHHIMVCPDFIQYNNCHSTKCNLPHIKLSHDNQDGSRKRPRRRSSVSTNQIVSSGERMMAKKGAQTADNLVIQPKLVHDSTETLDFIPLSSSPVHDHNHPVSPCSNHSNDPNDGCDLSILPRFLANMIQNDYNSDESE